MTDKQYYEERKHRIKLEESAYQASQKIGLTGGRLSEILIAKYGKDKFILMEDYELENFLEWITKLEKEFKHISIF